MSIVHDSLSFFWNKVISRKFIINNNGEYKNANTNITIILTITKITSIIL